jgi:hypothetical protein
VSNKAVYFIDKFLSVEGDLAESPLGLLGPSASFTITDNNGGLFATNDQLSVSGSGFDNNEGVVFERFREYNGSDQYTGTQTAPSSTNVTIDGSGNISGNATRDGSAYDASAVSIRYYILTDGTSGATLSTNSLPIQESVAPTLDSAHAVALDTIRLFFSEPVFERGTDASGNFDLSGSVTTSDLIAIGGDTTATWNLVISGLTDRGLGGLTIGYNSSASDDSLADPSLNEVDDTDPDSTVVDLIPPDVTTLRNSADNADLSIGDFIGNTSYTLNARVANITASDATLDGCLFEGSDDGDTWNTIGEDTSYTVAGSDALFSVSWSVSSPTTRYKVLRARSYDGAVANGRNNALDSDDNLTLSAVVGSTTDGTNDNFEDTYQAIIEQVVPTSIGQSSGSIRAAVVVELQSNYGIAINTFGDVSFTVSDTTSSTEKWWSVSSGGTGSDNSINLTVVSTDTADTVWYSNNTAGGPNKLSLVETGTIFQNNSGRVDANGKTVTVTISKIVNVSLVSPAVDSNIDSSGTAGDLLLTVYVDGDEDTGDDFRILWGFSNVASPSPGDIAEIDSSGDLTPPAGGGNIQHNVPADSLQNLSSTYLYMFYWAENVTTTADSTVLDGFPIKASPARLILNPELVTAAGDNGADAAGGDFTPGVNNQEVVSIKFTTDPTQATIKISGLVFDYTAGATADEDDISAFHLYRDAGTIGTYDSGLDVLLDDFPIGPGDRSVNFNEIAPVITVTGSGVHVLVTVDVKSGANGNHTLGLVLSTPGKITFDGSAQVINGPNSSLNKRTFSNIGTSQDYSLPVTLISFKAVPSYAKIVLEWLTASEENNAGFYLMRADEKAGDYRRLNEQLIEGNGNTSVTHYYQFEDTDVEIEQTYYYKLFSVDFNGDVYEYPTIAAGAAVMLPQSFSLKQNFPNPFNPTTKMSFDVPQESNVKLEVYNMLGQKIRTLVDGRLQPGIYQNVIWDAKDDRGNSIANGIYYLVFTADAQNIKQVRKMVFMK